jgi:DNA polymerase-3 subunit alpha
MNTFVHLHTHSDYSPQDGAQTVKQIAEKAAKLEMPAVALTDHGRAGGLLQFKKACEKVNIKPIYGIELYVAPESRFIREKLDNHTKTSYHLTVLAQNYEGLKNIFRLTSKSWIEGYYYKPRVDMELLQQYSEGLIVLSGCGSSRLSNYIMEDKFVEAVDHTKEMLNLYGDRFYIEIQNHGINWQEPLKKCLISIGDKFGIPVVATQDSHYPNKEDSELHNHICKLSAGDLQFDSDQSYFKSRAEMEKMFTKEEHVFLDNTLIVADRCNCEWDYSRTIWPVYNLPKDKTPETELRELAYKGLERIGKSEDKEYIKRIEYELEVIKNMGFPNYFLIVQDFIAFAKSKNIPVGPGRGSGAGSLVCYCLGITDIDPIKYELYFERFLNPARISLPDLDIDLCKSRRNEVIKYMASKYGEDRISQIGTYSVFKPRGSLRAFARVCGEPIQVGEKLAALVPPDISGKQAKFEDILANVPEIRNTPHDKIIQLAVKAEGLKMQAGVHAAGLVVADKPINEVVPLFTGRHEEIASQFDMHDVEDVGLVKFDFLGLKNLTVIAETIDLIKQRTGKNIQIEKIEDRDEKVYKLFKEGKLDGIFQFETSSGFRELCIKVKPEYIEDLAAITSLYRPGPLDTGLVDKYVEGRNGANPEYLFPELKSCLENTYGVMCYQEQIMKICTDIAGYSLSEADNMRKIIGKKLPEKMKLERERFISGCVKNNISESNATKLFNDIEGFASYSFNKCITGSTLVLKEDGSKISINEIKNLLENKESIFLKSFDVVNKTVIKDECIDVVDCGIQEVFELKLSDGSLIECTENHRFLCIDNKMHTVKEIIKYGIDILSCDIL